MKKPQPQEIETAKNVLRYLVQAAIAAGDPRINDQCEAMLSTIELELET